MIPFEKLIAKVGEKARLKANKKYSGEWFRSTDLWVMSPARYHCATPLVTDYLLADTSLKAKLVGSNFAHISVLGYHSGSKDRASTEMQIIAVLTNLTVVIINLKMTQAAAARDPVKITVAGKI